jgi:hypothetical protein
LEDATGAAIAAATTSATERSREAFTVSMMLDAYGSGKWELL